MATAEELRREFTAYLDSKGMKYTTVDEADNIVMLAFAPSSNLGNKGYATKVYVDFDEEADPDGTMTVHFVAQDFAVANEDKLPEVFVRLNDLNKSFRWAKFWFDSRDNTISADGDATIFPGTAGQACLRCVIHISNVVERACDKLKDIAEIKRHGPGVTGGGGGGVTGGGGGGGTGEIQGLSPELVAMLLKSLNSDEERAAFLMEKIDSETGAKAIALLDDDMRKRIMMAMLAHAMS